MGGGSIFGGGKGGSDTAGEASREQARQAERYLEQTDPLRQKMLANWMNMQVGGYDPATSPLYGAGKGAIESQYGVARGNLLSSVPRGGGLTSGLANLEQGRAGGLAALASQIAQDEYAKAYGAAWGAPQVGFSGLSGAGATGAMATNAYANLLEQLLSAGATVGQGFGALKAMI